MAPTAAGEVLLAEARLLLARADRMVAAVRGERPELRVGFLSSVANYLLPAVVRTFVARHPGVTLTAHEVAIAELVAGLRDGGLDAGLTPRSSWPPWHEQYDADFARAGYRPRVVQRGTSPQNLLALVAAGMGVTRLPLSARTLRDTGVTFVPLTGERTTVVLAHLPGATHPALPALREVVHTVAGTDLSDSG